MFRTRCGLLVLLVGIASLAGCRAPGERGEVIEAEPERGFQLLPQWYAARLAEGLTTPDTAKVPSAMIRFHIFGGSPQQLADFRTLLGLQGDAPARLNDLQIAKIRDMTVSPADEENGELRRLNNPRVLLPSGGASMTSVVRNEPELTEYGHYVAANVLDAENVEVWYTVFHKWTSDSLGVAGTMLDGHAKIPVRFAVAHTLHRGHDAPLLVVVQVTEVVPPGAEPRGENENARNEAAR